MKKINLISIASLFLLMTYIPSVGAQDAKPVFADGEAQIVPAFEESGKWIRHDLWVKTEFDSDQDYVKFDQAVLSNLNQRWN